MAECDAEDVERAVVAGLAAFEDRRWARKASSERKAVLLKLADLIRASLEEMALLDGLDMGKLVQDGVTIDAPGGAHFFQWCAEAMDKVHEEVALTEPGDLALADLMPSAERGCQLPARRQMPPRKHALDRLPRIEGLLRCNRLTKT